MLSDLGLRAGTVFNVELNIQHRVDYTHSEVEFER